jgi:hypothetical protein
MGLKARKGWLIRSRLTEKVGQPSICKVLAIDRKEKVLEQRALK